MVFAVVDPTPYGAPPINLLAAARTPTDAPGVRWQDGVTYESQACGAVLLRDVCDPSAPVTIKDAGDERIVEAWGVYAESLYECSTLGWRETYQDRAVATALAELPRAVERELWTGELAQAKSHDSQRYLAGPAVTDLTPVAGAVEPSIAWGLLEEALAGVYSGQGIIHVGRFLFPSMSLNRNLLREGRVLRSEAGNLVVPGVGYLRSGPDGSAALTGTQAWAYITPMVTVRTGDVELPTAERVSALQIDRDTNRLQIRARIPFTVDWDGCAAFAVRVAPS